MFFFKIYIYIYIERERERERERISHSIFDLGTGIGPKSP